MTERHDVISSMKSLKHIRPYFMLIIGERSMKLITISLLIYVVLHAMELPLF